MVSYLILSFTLLVSLAQGTMLYGEPGLHKPRNNGSRFRAMKKIKIRLINRTDQLTYMDGEIKKPALERVQPLDHRDSLRLTTSFTRN
ncbi:hypothetical protein VNO78_35173 [Psophocarpus tetragonolobus]|uniref:Uncharacterized protein n=1 Tax=Psophocarpus tetragonolobus TaxID=3891 RepID=A0AAN9RGW2_PSOTE